ncbi:MAG: glycoside hydrolase family 44 protein [Anaerolineae bacterium]
MHRIGYRFILGVMCALFLLSLSHLPLQAAPQITFARQGTTESIYEDALASGWDNWSWGSTIDYGLTSPVHSGSAAISVTINEAWAGLYLHAHEAIPPLFETLRFWVWGNGASLVVSLYNEASDQNTQVLTLTPPANTWTQIDVPLTPVNGQPVGGITWTDATGGPQAPFFLDDIQLISSQIVTQTPLTLTIDASADQHPISDDIYGLNFADPALAADIRLPVNRWGGNATTRYNWQTDTTNHAADWYFENIPNDNDNPAALPNGSSSDRFIAQNVSTGTDSIITVPLIGWTPSDRVFACGFPVTRYGAQQDTDPYAPDCGNGLLPDGTPIVGNDPADTSTAIGPENVQAWMQHLIGQFGTAANGGVRFYNLDNEPSLWNSTHRDVHPDPLSYDELRDRTFEYAAAIKATDPDALTLGPVEWGWPAYFYSALDTAAPEWWSGPTVDRTAHGDMELVAWYLDQMRQYEAQHGVRILDYLDLHFYPQAEGVGLSPAGSAETQALRLRSVRGLWDPTYIDETWINDTIRLIPRMHDWIDQYYPGTRIAITEYNFGALEDINGALAQADVLGIFGREGVDLATMWDPPTPDQPAAYAFRMYRNYDGKGSGFGETSVHAASSDQGRLSVYAALRSDGALTIVVINKTSDLLSSPISLSGFSGTNAEVYRYSAVQLDQIVRESDVVISADGTPLDFPPNAITLLVVHP